MSIAFHYTSIKPRTGAEREVFGLQVAIADLVRAYLRHATAETFSFLVGTNEEWREIQSFATEAGIDPSRLVALDRRFPEKNLRRFKTVFCPEPDTHRLLWQRQLAGAGGFAYCGLAHAISGLEAGNILQDYCLAPSEASDAIVCPSVAVKNAIRKFWDGYEDYLNQRFKTAYRCPVQLPVIPLGIDVEKFSAKTTAAKRAEQRRLLGLGETDIVLLWVGRLSAAIKAHPLAMFRAAEQAAARTDTRVHLVMVGYFVPVEAEEEFKKLAADICQNVSVTFVAANDPRFPDGLWAGGDVFLSLIDNMQESFGLTPIEAMAAGLPRVISDWDGYRDSVTDGVDGFLIRTTQPPAGNGFDLTADVLSGREVYGGFLAKTALTVAIDEDQAADRLAQLIARPDLRRALAEKAKTRLLATYDWKRVIPAYEALWKTQETQKNADAAAAKDPYSSALPQLPDPYTMYASYPTTALCEDDVLTAVENTQRLASLLRYSINTYAHDVLAPPQSVSALLDWLQKERRTKISAAFSRFPEIDKPRLWRTLGWLQKLGLLKIQLAKRQ